MSEHWQKVNELFHAVLEHEPGQRSAFLQDACAGDEVLRLEVESLIAAHERPGSFVDAAAYEVAANLFRHDQSGPLAGQQIGHYEILGKIGEGGMGEVYRAKDTKLGRDVAIKVLPAAFVRDESRRKRFHQEARALAALNHPHIAAIYGFEDTGDICALVLELVEGPTLADRLEAGALPLKEALPIARQLADALEAAHEKGIVHRDLKPANIKVTPDRVVKVLDFGLAKALAQEAADHTFSQAPTRTGRGIVVGTPAYMSPEQASGQNVDKRTDVWAFGCVLYEMLSGRSPFPGDSVAQTFVAILDHEPDWNNLPEATPEAIRRLLRRCLEKEPKQRMHHLADARIELDEVIPTLTTRARVVPKKTKRNRRFIAGVAATLPLLALGIYVLLNNGAERISTRPQDTVVVVNERQITTNPIEDPIVFAAISPDGKYVAYNDSTAIRIRLIDTGETRALSVPPDFCYICARFSWSRDGTKILADGEAGQNQEVALWVISTLAGQVRKLLDDSAQGAFSPDGSLIAFWKDKKYWLMGPNGEEPRPFMPLETRYEYRGPKWSPDGHRLVYLKNRIGRNEGSIESRALADDSTTALFAGARLLDFWWTPDGRLIYSQVGASEEAYELWQLPIDAKTAQRIGEPVRLTRWFGYSPGLVSVSADGKRIITTKGRAQSDVYVAELEANGQRLKPERRLTLDTSSDWPAGWTKEGEVLFFSDRNGVFNIFKQKESVQTANLAVPGREDARAPQISPDGMWLLYMVWSDPKQAKPARIMRAPQSGALAETVLEANGTFAAGITFSATGEQDPHTKGQRSFPDFRCPSSEAASCVLAEADHGEVLFTFFDPVSGRRGEAARVSTTPAKFFWDVSPDGSRLAYAEFQSGTNDHITILSLKDRTTREVTLKEWTSLNSLSWSADGLNLFVTTSRREGGDLLRVTLNGDVKLLRQETGRWFANPRPSPDGRLLAFGVTTTDSNVWLIETK
jgi:eukaryotic-like serine/threonine-protein kinase